MKTFVLILTIYQYHGSSIQTVPGFSSVEACKAAYAVWRDSVTGPKTYADGYKTVHGACVEVR